MAESEAVPKTLADTVTLSRELREEGQIDGQVKLYNVDDEGEFESDAELFFERTLMTQGLREALSILRDSLTGDDPRGTHILYGPYGSGKSHQMVALYHCFDDPAAAGAWGGDSIEGFEEALPDSATPVTVAMQNEQYEFLWEPFFEALDYDPGTYESGGYPDMQTIQEAVGDETVAFIVDELEDWFDTLSGDRKSANKGFLQSLLESTALSDLELYTIVSVLREGSEVHDILNREQAVEVNMNNQVDKREVLRHRLIDSVNEAAAREIVNEYYDAYDQAEGHVDVPDGLLSEMHELYPFHPVLLDTLETRYYADEGNQNTRGMIYLFSKVLLEMREETDLITHGDIDAIEFEDELAKLNYERLNAATGDIKNRIDEEEVPHGRRILNTILLYSLKPSEGEGAETSEIVMGAFESGDLVSDVVLNLERLHGVAWHLHKLNGKYAIRDKQNPNALIRNAAVDVSERSAKAETADILSDIFGSNAYPVGFRTDDIRELPDDRDIKVVIKDSDWTPDEVKRVITNDGRGREWRNTLVFVQPSGDKAIESGTRYIDKARYIEGARQVLADDSLDDEIRESIRGMKEQEESELRDELELAYGEALNVDDPLSGFDDYDWMELGVLVEGGEKCSAADIAQAASSSEPLDLRDHVWPIVEDLLDRRGEISFEDVYEQFLRDPELPIPGSANAVLNATVDALSEKSVLVRDSDGFRDELGENSLDDTLVWEDKVDRWGVDEVEQELRRRFGSDTTAIDIGDLEFELLDDGEIWMDGDSHDVVMRAVGRLNSEDQYVVVHGNEILDKPQSDATLRYVGDAEVVGAAYLSERIQEAIDEQGSADLGTIIGEIRADETVFLPPDETESAALEAVNDFLVDDYVLEAGGRYLESLGDRDPTTVKLVPTVSDRVGTQILEHIEGLDPDTKFTVGKIADRFSSDVTEDMVTTFLLQNIGREEDPAYVVGPTGSDDASDWMPGYHFRVFGDGPDWRFEYKGDDVTAMRRKWRDEHQDGVVDYGDVTLMLPDKMGVPGDLQGTADVERTQVSLTLRSGQEYTAVYDLFERIPDEASSLKIEISFE